MQIFKVGVESLEHLQVVGSLRGNERLVVERGLDQRTNYIH